MKGEEVKLPKMKKIFIAGLLCGVFGAVCGWYWANQIRKIESVPMDWKQIESIPKKKEVPVYVLKKGRWIKQ